MSKFDNFNPTDLAELEQMSTEELNDILDASIEPDARISTDTIMLVLEVLEARAEDMQMPDLDAAWEAIKNENLPQADQAASKNKHEMDNKNEHTVEPLRPKRRSFTKVAGIAAAVALVIFAAGTLITPVEGTNLWTVIANWTKETLGISTEGEKVEDSEIPEQLVELSERLKEYKLDVPYLLPTYIPKGYHTTATIVDERDDAIVVICQMENGSEAIAIQYSLLKEEVDGSQIQKNEDNPEIYLAADGTPVYIIQNMDVYNAIWTKGDIEIMILNIPAKEELIKMIDSI